MQTVFVSIRSQCVCVSWRFVLSLARFPCVWVTVRVYGWVGNRLLCVLTTSIKSTHLMFRMNSNGSFRAPHQMFSLHASHVAPMSNAIYGCEKKTTTNFECETKLIKWIAQVILQQRKKNTEKRECEWNAARSRKWYRKMCDNGWIPSDSRFSGLMFISAFKCI